MKNRNVALVLSYINTIISVLCGLFLSSYLIRVFGETDYGIYQTVCSFANYLVLLEFGVGTVLTRNIVRSRQSGSEEEIQKNISTLFTISLLLSIIIAVVAFVFYCLIGTIYSSTLSTEQIDYAKKIFIFESIFLLLSFFSNVTNGIFLGFEKYRLIPALSIIKILIRTALLVSLSLFFRYSLIIAVVDAIIAIVIIVFGVCFSIFKLKIRFTLKYFDVKVFKDALPLCLAILIQAIVNQANSNVDKFVLGIKVGPESVTLYSVALYIYSIFSTMTTIPISIYSPQIYKEVTKGTNEDAIAKEMVAPSRWIVLIGGSILFGFVSCGRQFISIVYGKQFFEAWIIAIIIMVPMLINMSNGILISILDAKNKRIFRSYILLATTIANVILTIFWIDLFGVIGAALATAICTIIGQITLMNIFYVKKMKIDIIYMYKNVFKGILAFQLIAALIGFGISFVIDNIIVSFVVCGSVYVIIFSILFLLFGASKSEKAVITRLVNKVLKK